MNKQGTILIVDDNKGVLTAVQLLLKNYFTKVITLASPVNPAGSATRRSTGSGSSRYEFYFRYQ